MKTPKEARKTLRTWLSDLLRDNRQPCWICGRLIPERIIRKMRSYFPHQYKQPKRYCTDKNTSIIHRSCYALVEKIKSMDDFAERLEKAI